MTYTVVWKPSAEALLAHLWNIASDRAAVAAAADALDAALRHNPQTLGESRSGGRRVMFIAP
jgi:plasmid stabilization system protein ParE